MATYYALQDENGRKLASFHANQIEENDTRLRDSVALAVGGNRSEPIRRAKITRYSNGDISLSPRRANGSQCLNARGNLATYWLKSFEFNC